MYCAFAIFLFSSLIIIPISIDICPTGETHGCKFWFLAILCEPNLLLFVSMQDMFLAGTDTTTTELEWAVAALVKEPEFMAKLPRELSDALHLSGRTNSTVYEKLRNLPYPRACIRDTLVLYPSVQLLLPHRASETCQVLGYTIPKDCQVLVNIWATGRDPTIWNDPSAFLPERFLDRPDLAFKVADY